jgi:hypothetical protein
VDPTKKPKVSCHLWSLTANCFLQSADVIYYQTSEWEQPDASAAVEHIIFELFLTMMLISNLLFILARLVVQCCSNCCSNLLRYLLLMMYVSSLTFFSGYLFLTCLGYMQAEYWTKYEWIDAEHLARNFSIVQLGAWFVISLTAFATTKLFLFGAIAFVKENY